MAGTVTDEAANTFNWMIGWLILIGVIIAISKSRVGYAAIYYALVLILVFLVVTQYKWIAKEVGIATTISLDTGKAVTSVPKNLPHTASNASIAKADVVSSAPYGPGGLLIGGHQ
jgi:hypothetical protein